MLELQNKPLNIDGIKPYLYEQWYCGSRQALRHIEYHRRPMAIIENIDFKPGMKILDIGCDWGYLLMHIKDKFKDISCHGIDISDQNTRFGNALAAINGYEIHCKYGNTKSIKYDNNSFDCIVSTETFEHLFPEDRDAILKECLRVLKPGSCLLMTTPSKYGLAEITKHALAKFVFFKKLIPMLPGKVKKEGFAPQGATKGDKMTNIAESMTSLRKKIINAGFSVVAQKAFIFMPEITPNPLFRATRIFESLLERARIFNSLATTQFIKAKKP